LNAFYLWGETVCLGFWWCCWRGRWDPQLFLSVSDQLVLAILSAFAFLQTSSYRGDIGEFLQALYGEFKLAVSATLRATLSSQSVAFRSPWTFLSAVIWWQACFQLVLPLHQRLPPAQSLCSVSELGVAPAHRFSISAVANAPISVLPLVASSPDLENAPAQVSVSSPVGAVSFSGFPLVLYGSFRPDLLSEKVALLLDDSGYSSSVAPSLDDSGSLCAVSRSTAPICRVVNLI
jgi:hypothetical protein